MNQTQHLECDTSDCVHWENGVCVKETPVTIREHQCTDYEERVTLAAATVTIELSDGLLQNVYASPDLPEIRVEVIDLEARKSESEQDLKQGRRLLNAAKQSHNLIY